MLCLTTMVISILTRNTRLTDQAVWQAALGTVLSKINDILSSQPGFVSVQYAWNIDDPGRFSQITTWDNEDACRHYVREGAAANVATIEEAAIPTAPYPNGRWVRETFATADA
jgi:heme-degrading monooxygenase HmoA